MEKEDKEGQGDRGREGIRRIESDGGRMRRDRDRGREGIRRIESDVAKPWTQWKGFS